MRTRFPVWLVVLLVCVLPLRAAIAAGGFGCHGRPAQAMPMPAQTIATPAHDRHAMLGGHGADARHAKALDDLLPHDATAPAAAHADCGGMAADDTTCLACAAAGGASALPTSVPTLLPPHALARCWTRVSVSPPPGPVPAGLERPPRRA